MWKELTATEWFEEIVSGLEFRQKYGLESSWAELEALFMVFIRAVTMGRI